MKNLILVFVALAAFLVSFLTACSTKTHKETNRVALKGTPLTFLKPQGFSVQQTSRQVYDESLKREFSLSLIKVFPSKKQIYDIEITKLLDFNNLSDYSKSNGAAKKIKTYHKINNEKALEFSFESRVHARTVKRGGKTYVYDNHLFVIESTKGLYQCSLKISKRSPHVLDANKSLVNVCKSIEFHKLQ